MANYLDGIEGGKHDSDSTVTTISKPTFTVSVEFTDMEASNPLKAAKKACDWLLENEDARNMVYVVTNEMTGEKFTVDLSEDDENAVLKD
jgi:hypothetical protein